MRIRLAQDRAQWHKGEFYTKHLKLAEDDDVLLLLIIVLILLIMLSIFKLIELLFTQERHIPKILKKNECLNGGLSQYSFIVNAFWNGDGPTRRRM